MYSNMKRNEKLMKGFCEKYYFYFAFCVKRKIRCKKRENREFLFAKVGTVVHEAKQKVMKQNNAKNKGNFFHFC